MMNNNAYAKYENKEIASELKKLSEDIQNFSEQKNEFANFWKKIYLGLSSNN